MLKNILKKPLTVIVTFVVFSLLGLSMLKDIPLDFLPQFEAPVVAISTIYPMATPGEVEESVTRVIEESVVNISGVKDITSISKENHSLIILWFNWGEDTDVKSNDVRDKVEFIKGKLPSESEEPMIVKFDPNALPVMELTLKGSRDMNDLYSIAEDSIKIELEKILGVASVDIEGGTQEIVKVEFNLNRMEALNISINQVAKILKSQNIQLGSGAITEGNKDYLIKTQGDFASLEDIRNVSIRSIPGRNGKSGQEIYLKDFADVTMGFEDPETAIFIDGEPGISLSVVKRTEANTVDTAEDVKKAVEKLNKKLPGDLEIIILSDQSKQIKTTLNEVLSSAWLGLIFAVLIILLFLRQLRSTLIVAISLPVSLLITIAGLALTGNTINMLTLSGLLIGIGMIVDGSIVMLENIFVYRNKGVMLEPSAYLGAKEMAAPITGSTLTSIFVFFPIILFGSQLDIFGILFESMSITVIIALLSSLVVAVFLIPVLAGKIIKVYTPTQRPIKNRVLKAIDGSIERVLTFLDNIYEKSLKTVIKHKKKTLLIFILLLIGSIFQIKNLGFQMMAPTEADSVNLNIELPVGTTLEKTEEVLMSFQKIIDDELPGIDSTLITIGEGKFSYKASILVILEDLVEREVYDGDVKKVLRSYFDYYPDYKFEFGSTDQASRITGGSGLEIEISGTNLNELEATSKNIMSLIKENSNSVTEVSSDFEEGLPQVEIVFDRGKIYDLGLNTQTVAGEIRGMLAGTTAGTYYDGEDEYEITLRLREEDRESRINLDKMFVLNSKGHRIPLSSIATLVDSESPAAINRENRSRIIKINCTPVEGIKSNELRREIESLIMDNIVVPDGIEINYGGDMEQLIGYAQALIMIMGFALLLVFAVMVSQFESLKAPFIIFLSLPMLIIGVVIAYTLMGMPLSMFSFIGILMLSGIVVNNGIVLVDRINLYIKRGMDTKEAAIEASKSRLRPILMTTLTTICAMIPMAYFPNPGTEMIQPLGVTVTSGLAANTVITLFMVPILYTMIMKKKKGESNE